MKGPGMTPEPVCYNDKEIYTVWFTVLFLDRLQDYNR